MTPLEDITGASGTVYRITDISAGRAAYVMKKSLELLLCQKAVDFNEFLNKLMAKLNEGKIADSAVMVSDMSKGVAMIDGQVDACMYYCAAIFNAEGEDIGVVDELKFEDKIKDWRNIESAFFLKAALLTIPGLMQSWQKVATSSEMFKAGLIEALKDL